MAYTTSKVGFLLVVGLVTGCATARTGSGAAISGTDSVKFSWTGSGNVSGSMTATVVNGGTFTGRFFQITSGLTNELGPHGSIWHQEGLFDVGPELQYVAHYTGRVVANLRRADGALMQCHLKLTTPVDGIAGGARGECQLPDGASTNARFPAD